MRRNIINSVSVKTIMRILGILIIYISLVLGQQIQQFHTKTGLYYEPLKGLRFTKTEWKLVTAINIKSILTQYPEIEISKFKDLKETCKTHIKGSFCDAHLSESYVSIMLDKIETYHQQIKHMTYPDTLSTRNNRNVPFGFIGTLSRTLFGTLNEEDAANFNHEIDELYTSQSTLSKILANQTHIVQSDLHNLHFQVNNLNKKVNETYRQLLKVQEYYKKERTEANYVIYKRMIESMNMYIRSSLEGYLSSLKSVINAIYFARMGQLHPELIGPSTLTKAAKTFAQREHHLELPVPISEIYSGELSKISRISINYYEEKLILVMHIPLLEPTHYLLYKLHSYPTLQIYGNNSQGSAYIHPRTTYLVISQEHDKYSMIHEHELPNCYSLMRIFVCTPSYPLYSTTMQPICEVSLLTNNQFNPHKDCDIRVSKTFKPYWKHLMDTQMWLFSLPDEENLYTSCNNKNSSTALISGAGILKLESNCITRNAYATMMGYETIEMEIDLKHQPSFVLNITQLLPEIQTYELLSPNQTESDIPRIIMDANVPESLNYDSSLNEIEQKLMEISTRKRQENKQDLVIYNIGGITIILLIGIIICMIKKLCCNNKKKKEIKLRKIRKHDIERNSNYDELTEEELENFSTYRSYTGKRANKKIYDPPKRSKPVPCPEITFTGPELKNVTHEVTIEQTDEPASSTML